ncbi:MAG: NAD-dependent epimerase/dehydratase family protein [Brevinema sp.]
MTKVFITGATSMIGVAFLKECIANNCKATILVRENSLNNSRLPSDSDLVEYIYGDIEHLNLLNLSCDFDVFYHFAWLGTDKIQRNLVDIQSKNIQITLEAIKFAKKIGCKKFFGAGSQAEYGFVDGVISEDTAVNPTISYGIAKYATGRLSELLCKELGLEWVWGRIFSVYGPCDNSFAMIPQCLDHIFNKKVFQLSSCEQMWNYLHCNDIAKALYLLGEHGQGMFNIAHPESFPLKEYLQTIINITHGDEYIHFGDTRSKGIHPNIEKLKKYITWDPLTTFEQGILDLYYKKN